jgi:hypothetical protein
MNTITFNGPEEPIKKLRDFISEQANMLNFAQEWQFSTPSWLGTFLERAEINPDSYSYRGQIVA